MFIHQISGHRWSAKGELTSFVTVKDETTSIQVELSSEEKAELEALAERVFARHQAGLAAKMAQPLETNLLAPPEAPIEEADFDEVPF